MDISQILKILETIGIAAVLFLIYHLTMKAGKKSIERREKEEQQKAAAKARQREQIREAVTYSINKRADEMAQKKDDTQN